MYSQTALQVSAFSRDGHFADIAAMTESDPTETLAVAWRSKVVKHKTAIFRQVNQNNPRTHHDAVEFPDGQIVLLTFLREGLQATVLQLPATAVGSKAPQRAAYV